MFYYLNGTVAHIEPYLAVIDCGGVGYACRTTTYTLASLKKGNQGSSTPTLMFGKTPWSFTALLQQRSSTSSSS